MRYMTAGESPGQKKWQCGNGIPSGLNNGDMIGQSWLVDVTPVMTNDRWLKPTLFRFCQVRHKERWGLVLQTCTSDDPHALDENWI